MKKLQYICSKRVFINMEKQENSKGILTEELLIKESKDWNAHEWIEYLANQDGTMTMDEFREFNKNIIEKMFND